MGTVTRRIVVEIDDKGQSLIQTEKMTAAIKLNSSSPEIIKMPMTPLEVASILAQIVAASIGGHIEQMKQTERSPVQNGEA
jgi:hypothetical protein